MVGLVFGAWYLYIIVNEWGSLDPLVASPPKPKKPKKPIDWRKVTRIGLRTCLYLLIVASFVQCVSWLGSVTNDNSKYYYRSKKSHNSTYQRQYHNDDDERIYYPSESSTRYNEYQQPKDDDEEEEIYEYDRNFY